MRAKSKEAFTLVELLMVIAVIAILAALLLPALSKSKMAAHNVVCLNNLKQLEDCCHLYTGDYDDFLVPNKAGGFVSGPGSTNSPTVVTNVNSWCPGIAPQDTTADNLKLGLLYPYNTSPAIYHCPADQSAVDGFPNLTRTRSYCMDISLSCDDAGDTFRKFSQISDPSPSGLFVFIDTHESDIWDATFGIFGVSSRWGNYWLDLPADRHNRGANLSFADGHVEHWKWKAPKTFITTFEPAYDTDDLDDLRRLEDCVKPDVD